MKRMMALLVAVFLLVLSLAGCGTGKENAKSAVNTKEVSFPLTIKDNSGTEVTLKKKPERIISLVPSSTEVLYALGLGDKIVGVSTYDNYPAEVKNKEKVGDMNANSEKVVSLKPDVIFASPLNKQATDSLRKLGLPVVVIDAKIFDEIYSSIETIGKATGSAVKAAELVAKMKKDVADIQSKVKGATQKPKVFVEVDDQHFTTGKGTFMNDMIEIAGGTNIASDLTGWQQLSEEQIIQRNPDVIFDTYAYSDPNAAKNIKERANWKGINALKNSKVIDLDSDMTSRPGPRITEALKQIAKYLHPELFQ